MKSDELQALIEHESAELKGAFPRIAHVHCRLEEGKEGASLRLDIRWPQHQTLLCGPLKPDPIEAVHAAFAWARESIRERRWAPT